MDKDLLSNDFTRNIDISKIDKNLLMVKVVIVIGSVYSILEIWRWVKLFLANMSFYLAPANFHYILLFVFTSIPLTILFIACWFSYLKANRLMKLSILNNDSEVFNKAYGYINRSCMLSIIATCISLLSMLVSLFVE
jgi:hypothetical protein